MRSNIEEERDKNIHLKAFVIIFKADYLKSGYKTIILTTTATHKFHTDKNYGQKEADN